MQRLQEYLSSKQLQQKYQNCQDPVEAKRWYLIWQVSMSKTVKEVALTMNIDYDYALSIVRKYNRCGPAILKDNRRLSWKLRKELCQEIQNYKKFLNE